MSLPQPRAGADGEQLERDDVELLAAVRVGDRAAFGVLYERHVAAARRLARQLTPSPAEADDLVAEAFAKMLEILSSGGGPTTAFRSYLLTTVRNTLYDRLRRDHRLELSDDMTRHDSGDPWVDPAITGFESTTAARAFARLPERWQTVLWHSEVEQESPAEIALLLGLTPNGVSALAYRAREGLRQAYLREHVSAGATARCRWTVDHLAGRARGTLSRRERTKVDSHLLDCDRCRVLAGELEDVNSGLRGILAPLVLGGAAAAYLASSAAPDVAAAGSAATAGATAAAGGSTLGAVTGWVGGTAAGKAAAAAVAAVAVGGAVVGIGALEKAGPPSAARAATGRGAGLPVPAEVSGAPAGTAGSRPGAGPAAGAAAPVPGSSSSAAARNGPDRTGAAGSTVSSTAPRGGTAPTRGTTPVPGTVAPPPVTGRAALDVGSPAAAKPLRQGKPGEIRVTIRNTGTGPADSLVATVRLPGGLTVRAGSSNSPADWHCTGSGQVATCSVATVPAGGGGTVRVKVFVADDAVAGPVTGQVTGSGGLSAAIPSTVVAVS